MTVKEILEADVERRRRFDEIYNPETGEGAIGARVGVLTPLSGLPKAYVPEAMLNDPDYPEARFDENLWKRVRCRYDFEYWCITCATIKHKLKGMDVRFRLNRPQRRLVAIMEDDRVNGRPIRVILLKARQWGGSTVVQLYMAWIQSCICRNWNSLICAHVKDTASGIRGMYSKLLANYPIDLWEGDEKPQFRPYERSLNVREIAGRGCRVTVGSSENHEAVRGADYAMAHLSETAFWSESSQRSPDKFIRAICGAIALAPNSLIVMESTANGVGNYFHSEWLRCKDGAGDKHAVFVPWHEIEIYRLEPPDREALAASLDDYEMRLWDMGLSLDQIYWYRRKLSEYSTRDQMEAEFPTTDVEAFLNTGSGVFATAGIEALRAEGCTEVKPLTGDVNSAGTEFTEDRLGAMQLWRKPVADKSYVVAVDVGGRSRNSDWSVIAVLTAEVRPEVVAQWRGHIDHDLLAEKSRQIATYYNEALLVIESNTLETEAGVSCDSNMFILNRLAERYSNVYRRVTYDTQTHRRTSRIGFHTNRATKAMLITGLIEAVREGGYIEHDAEACNELATYEQQQNGTFAAKLGYHDDILMTRAIALHVIPLSPELQPPVTMPPYTFW
jgi:hypothetical protein